MIKLEKQIKYKIKGKNKTKPESKIREVYIELLESNDFKQPLEIEKKYKICCSELNFAIGDLFEENPLKNKELYNVFGESRSFGRGYFGLHNITL